jgi:3-phenylpropionate/cinnamic acid dioxygenase small subunit
VNYLELYILGSYGLHRKQLQVINQYDSCCFAGTKWETYKDIIRERVHELRTGEFELFLDATHREHLISEAAMSRILDELASNSR